MNTKGWKSVGCKRNRTTCNQCLHKNKWLILISMTGTKKCRSIIDLKQNKSEGSISQLELIGTIVFCIYYFSMQELFCLSLWPDALWNVTSAYLMNSQAFHPESPPPQHTSWREMVLICRAVKDWLVLYRIYANAIATFFISTDSIALNIHLYCF